MPPQPPLLLLFSLVFVPFNTLYDLFVFPVLPPLHWKLYAGMVLSTLFPESPVPRTFHKYMH